MGEELLWAIKNGDIDAVKKAYEKFDVNAEILNGRKGLHYASDYGHVKVIEYLCSRGAKVNDPDKHGITPLLAAIYEDHKDCVQMLLNKGADSKGKAPDGTPYADCAESDEIKQLLKNK